MATSLKLDKIMVAKVQHLAEVKHRSMHWIMCEAIRKYVEKEEQKESFRQEAIESWNHYCETGKHLTLDEVKEWLDVWGDDIDTNLKKAPKCHK